MWLIFLHSLTMVYDEEHSFKITQAKLSFTTHLSTSIGSPDKQELVSNTSKMESVLCHHEETNKSNKPLHYRDNKKIYC